MTCCASPQILRGHLERCRRAVITGPAGTGKTTLACAWLRAHLERDPGARIRFVVAADLLRECENPTELAVSADVLVLDDLGAELAGAPARSGLAAQRIGPASRVICERFDRGRTTVVTTGLSREQVQAIYDDRTARRLYEGAVLVELGEAPR